MKNFLKLFGIIALVSIIGFSMAACDDGYYGYDDGIRPLDKPTGVTAVRDSPDSTTVTVSWNAVEGATSYRVYYSSDLDSSNTSGRFEGSSVTTSFLSYDKSLTGTHYFRVEAQRINDDYTNSFSSSWWVELGVLDGEKSKPRAPTRVNARADSSSSIRVEWGSVPYAVFYSVYYEIGSSTTKNRAINIGNSNSYTHTGLTASTTYTYYITATSSAGESVYSSSASATTMPPVPSTPTNVTATANSSSSISVSWASVSGATSYDVYCAVGSSSSAARNYAGTISGTLYTHTGLTASTTYYYWITAKNSGGASGYSSPAYATTRPDDGGGTTIPSAPTGVTATANSSSSITVSWYSVSGATSYDVYYATASYLTPSFVTNTSGTSYTHTGLTASTTYYYWIKAKNSAGESGYSLYDYDTTRPDGGGGGHDIDPAFYGTWRDETGGTYLIMTFSSSGITWGGAIGNGWDQPGATWTARNNIISYTWSGGGGTVQVATYTMTSSTTFRFQAVNSSSGFNMVKQ